MKHLQRRLDSVSDAWRFEEGSVVVDALVHAEMLPIFDGLEDVAIP